MDTLAPHFVPSYKDILRHRPSPIYSKFRSKGGKEGLDSMSTLNPNEIMRKKLGGKGRKNKSDYVQGGYEGLALQNL